MIGKTVGKYRIVGQLGRGGMGTVYKAVDTTLQREVAIKILNADLADNDTTARFRAEATILASLNHPEIATIHEFFPSDNNDLLMVVEFVRGETLEKVSDCLGPMPPEQAAYVIDKVLSALDHTHRAGIVHRDLKPANIMVTDHGGIKIMDFGVARVRGAERMTLDGTLMGTPAYMATEQVLGREVDGRADLYSVGVVFYRLLTGVLPFKAETAMDMLQKQLSETPTPLDVHRSDLPDWCEAIVHRALAKAPDDRFQSAAEFRDTLHRVAGLITTVDITKSFATSVSGLATKPSRQNAVLERFGFMPARGIGGQVSTFEVPTYSFRGASLLTILAASLTVLAVAAFWRPETVTVMPTPQAPQTSETAQTAPRGVPQRATAGPASPASMPFVFDARIVLSDGDRRYERPSLVMLNDGKIRVHPKDADVVLRSLPYDAVLSISYSRGRRPLWNTKAGPTPVLAMRPGVFSLFRGDRHWISLRTKIASSRFVVLRMDDEAQAKRATSALEQRTGRTAQTIVERGLDE